MREEVLKIIRQIPRGKVATYGQIARLAGHPRAARQVGRILFGLRDEESDVPWHRVLNSTGSLSTYAVGSGELQLALLQREGIEFNAAGSCRLNRYLWQPED